VELLYDCIYDCHSVTSRGKVLFVTCTSFVLFLDHAKALLMYLRAKELLVADASSNSVGETDVQSPTMTTTPTTYNVGGIIYIYT